MTRSHPMPGFLARLFAYAWLLWATSGHAADTEAAIGKALQSGGHVVLIRHALAPGIGDPPNFTLGDCSTQRNLSDEGRDQARRIGSRLRANGTVDARIFSSQWCRCLETATLLHLGPIQTLPALNSFFSESGQSNSQTQALKLWLAGQSLSKPLILVTHQVNITALSGENPASGDLIVMRRDKDGALKTIGTLRVD